MLCSAFNPFIGFSDTRSPRVYCRSLRLLHDAYRSRAAGSVLCEGLRVCWKRYREYRRGGAELEYAMLGLETGSANERAVLGVVCHPCVCAFAQNESSNDLQRGNGFL